MKIFVFFVVVLSCGKAFSSEMEDRKVFCIQIVESPIFEKVNPLVTAVNVMAESASVLPGTKDASHPPPYGKGKPIYNWENFEKYIDLLFKADEKDSTLALEYTALRVIRQWYAEGLASSETMNVRKEVILWRQTLIQRLNIAEHPEIQVKKPPQVLEAQEERRKKKQEQTEQELQAKKQNEIKAEKQRQEQLERSRKYLENLGPDQKPTGQDGYIDRTYTILHWGEK